jgi:hypothetical protein
MAFFPKKLGLTAEQPRRLPCHAATAIQSLVDRKVRQGWSTCRSARARGQAKTQSCRFVAWEGVAEIKIEGQGCISFTVAGTPPAPAVPAGRRAAHLSEDSWDGDADFIVRIEGASGSV